MQNLNSANKEFKSILKKRGMTSNKMGDEISESWLRCISTSLDPFKDPKQSLISSILTITSDDFSNFGSGISCSVTHTFSFISGSYLCKMTESPFFLS
jgi:hypothetical protein